MTLAANCLICYKPNYNGTNTNSDCEMGEDVQTQNKGELLNDQVLVMFILRKLLQIPLSFCQSLLKELGNPSGWIWCCPACAKLIHTAFLTHTELMKVQCKFDSLKKKINTKLEDSKEREIDELAISDKGTGSGQNTADEIRNCFFYGNNSASIQTANAESAAFDLSFDDDVKSEPDTSEPASPMKIELDPLEFDFNINNQCDDENSSDNSSDLFNLKEYDDQYFPEFKSSPRLEAQGRKQTFGNSCMESEDTYFKLDNYDNCTSLDSSRLKEKKTAKEKKKRKPDNEIFDEDSNSEDEGVIYPVVVDGRYKCDLCDKDFKHLKDLKSHRRGIHYKELKLKPYKCKLCGKIVAARSSIISHMKSVHKSENSSQDCESEERFKCDLCDKIFKSSGTLNIHRRGRHYKELNLTPYKCTECDKILTTSQSLKLHVTKWHKHDFSIYCPVCKVGIVDKKSLESHMKVHTKEKPFMCTKCGKCFAGKQALEAHEIQIHTQEFKFSCDICSKKFPGRKQFVDHNSRFHSDKPMPYVCEVCGNGFHKPVLLLYHQRGYHYKELNLEPFKCSECEAVFTDFSGLLYHRKARHTNSEELNFACKECDRKFVHKGLMLLHVRREHKKEKSFQCSKCEKTFFTAPQLKIHTQSHTKDYEYKCPLCSKGTPYKYRHQRHMKTVHGVDPSFP